MVHHPEVDIRDRLDHNGRATITLGPGDTAWNPHSEKDPLYGPDTTWHRSVVEYQEFPDGTWTARVTDPQTNETHYRSER